MSTSLDIPTGNVENSGHEISMNTTDNDMRNPREGPVYSNFDEVMQKFTNYSVQKGFTLCRKSMPF